MLCVCLVRLSRASVRLVYLVRLFCSSRFVSSCSSLLILPPEQFELFECLSCSKRSSCSFRLCCCVLLILPPEQFERFEVLNLPTHCDALKSISLSLQESPSCSKCLTRLKCSECTEELECLECTERLKGFEVFGVNTHIIAHITP